MSRKTLIAFGLAVIAVIAAVVLLVTGGSEGSTDDALGDVELTDGGSQPRDLSVVDIRKATVTADGDELVFEATMQESIPEELPKQALGWRWELYEGGQMTWLVSANVDLGPNVSVIATQTGYQASTVDDTLPGEIAIDGPTLTVRLTRSEIEGLPAEFDWLLKTSLDGDRAKATSALAEDTAPD